MTNRFKKNDKVVMHTCGEGKGENEGRIWECRSDSFEDSAQQEVVFLDGFSGSFLCKYLQKVNLNNYDK